jgi:predicted N-acetyltransferase YhbS
VPLTDADPAAVESLLDAAFGKDRRTRTAYRLREGLRALPRFSFAAIDGNRLVGSLQTWPIALFGTDSEPTPLLLVGPVAVHPDRQRAGIGKALVHHALAAIDAASAPPSVLIGDAIYYGRFFGYVSAPTQRWRVPGPVDRDRLLVRLTNGQTVPTEGSLGPAPAALAA